MKTIKLTETINNNKITISLPWKKVKKNQRVEIIVIPIEESQTEEWDFWDEKEITSLGKTSGLKSSSYQS